jgi:hypothetical protein
MAVVVVVSLQVRSLNINKDTRKILIRSHAQKGRKIQ